MFNFRNIGIVNILLILVLITFVIPPQILNPIFLGVLLVTLIVRQIVSKQYFFKQNFNKVALCFISYFVLMVLSLIYTDDIKKGMRLIEGTVSFILVPLIPLFISKKEINLKWIAKNYVCFLCLIFFLLFFIAIYKNINENYTLEYIIDRLKGAKVKDGRFDYFNYWYFAYDKFTAPLKIQPIYLGLFVNVGLVLLLFLKDKIQSKSFYIQLTILSLFILLVASRAQILIFGFNYILFILFFDKTKKLSKILILTAFSILFLGVSIINPITRTRLVEAVTFKKAFYEDDFGGASIRLKKWESALQCIQYKPIIGYGIGDGKNELLKQYKKDKFYLGFYNKYNAHNQYLDTLLYLGGIGLLNLLLIFVFAYKYAFNNMCLLFFTNIFSLGFVTESMLNRQWGIMAFAFFLILFSTFNPEKNVD